jgi:outer membrane protein insertion porin family
VRLPLRSPSRLASLLLVGAVVLSGADSLRLHAQGAPTDSEASLQPFVGRRILSIEVSGAKRTRPETLLSAIQTKKGRRLDLATVREDLRFLWSRYKVRGAFKLRERADEAPPAEGEKRGVDLLLSVEEFRSFRRIEFQGLRHLTEEQARRLLQVDEGESPTELTGQHYARLLEERYRQDGYAFVLVRVLPDERRDLLILQVSEGPKVRVRAIDFVGNQTYPTSAFLGLTWNLLGSARVRSQSGILPFLDATYSRKKLDDDLERVQTWYRERGFLDAVVELRELKFSQDRSDVFITGRVHEGPRYRVASVEIDVQPGEPGQKPRFGEKSCCRCSR